MTLQQQAQEIIQQVADRLNPLFGPHGFAAKIQSEPSIFNEILIYEKNEVALRISACLHPQDYPNTLTVTLNRRVKNKLEYYNLQELNQMNGGNRLFVASDFRIYPSGRLSRSLDLLHEFCELLLERI